MSQGQPAQETRGLENLRAAIFEIVRFAMSLIVSSATCISYSSHATQMQAAAFKIWLCDDDLLSTASILKVWLLFLYIATVACQEESSSRRTSGYGAFAYSVDLPRDRG
jgi:hypothetical protein